MNAYRVGEVDVWQTLRTVHASLPDGATIGVGVHPPMSDGRWPCSWYVAWPARRPLRGDDLELSVVSDGNPLEALRVLLDFAQYYAGGADDYDLTPRDIALGEWWVDYGGQLSDIQYPPEGAE